MHHADVTEEITSKLYTLSYITDIPTVMDNRIFLTLMEEEPIEMHGCMDTSIGVNGKCTYDLSTV